MAKKGNADDTNATGALDLASLDSSLKRVANLLALIAIKGEDESEKARTLNAAGFEPAEIGALIGKTPNAISVMLYKLRKGSGSRRRRD